MPNTNLGSASMGEYPTEANSRPTDAEASPLNILPLEMANTMVIATKQSEKYSHGPRAKAISAIFWLNRAPSMALKKVPRKDATMPMARALPALPAWAMG